MSPNQPNEPKLYYITHIDNLKSIFSSGYLYSDARRIELALINTNIGMTSIKNRRLTRCFVPCHPGTTVGQYVPFYFCPRSIMLYIIYMKNHPDLTYRSGQEPIVHMQIDMYRAQEWAESVGSVWTFSDRNASDRLATFYDDLQELNQIDWNAVATNDWKQQEIQDGKQAEFLIYDRVSLELVEEIGVFNTQRANQVSAIIHGSNNVPAIAVERNWYYP